MGAPPPDVTNLHLLIALRSLVEWLAEEAVPHVIIGGVAVSLLAKPRFTQDLTLRRIACQRDYRIQGRR